MWRRGYYAGPPGGVNFNQTAAPDYGDFAYLSFTIGMTFQVSDTDIGSRQIRWTALSCALSGCLAGPGVVAPTTRIGAAPDP